jgi:hypothetical protein
VSAVSGGSALAQAAAGAGTESQADLAQDLTNPVANPVTVPLQINFDTDISPVDDSSKWQASLQLVLPFNLNDNGLTVGRLAHLREPTTPGKDAVIRSNQDTLYSAVVLDSSEPVTLTLPEIGYRYTHVINQDHYSFVETKPGDYRLTEESVGSRFAIVWIRTFADVNDPHDIAAAHKARPVDFLFGAAAGWAGLPSKASYYVIDSVDG